MLVAVTYLTNSPMHCGHFYLICVPIWVPIIRDLYTRGLWQIPTDT